MKWSIAGLLLLGVGAAFSASILVVSLKLAPRANTNVTAIPTETQIVLASRPLSAMSIVEGQSVVVKKVPIAEAPKNAMKQPTDVVGKLLTIPVVEGQPFTSGCFADEKSGARLASALKNGMRAVSVSLKPEKAGPLYPGCIVDVLVSLNRPSTEGQGTKEAMSMTLLQGIEVLAIDDISVMSDEAVVEPAKPETTTSSPTKRDRKDRLVTMMVKSNQAKALQLASQYGGVSLALRNPLDAAPVETDSTMLSDLADEYSRIVAVLAPPQAAGTASQGAAPNGNSAALPDAVSAGTAPVSQEQVAALIHVTQREKSLRRRPPSPKKWKIPGGYDREPRRHLCDSATTNYRWADSRTVWDGSGKAGPCRRLGPPSDLDRGRNQEAHGTRQSHI
jgi:pilus assembly protein CpaB